MLLGGCQAKEPTASAVAPAPDKSVTLPSDFATTDEVREKGTLNGSGDNSALLDGLMHVILDIRATAKANKDWTTSDHIRDSLNALGITVKDGKDGATYSF